MGITQGSLFFLLHPGVELDQIPYILLRRAAGTGRYERIHKLGTEHEILIMNLVGT